MQNRKILTNLNYFGTKLFLRSTFDDFVYTYESYRRLIFFEMRCIKDMSPCLFFHNLIWKFSAFGQFSKNMKKVGLF